MGYSEDEKVQFLNKYLVYLLSRQDSFQTILNMKFISSSDSTATFELAILGYSTTTKTWRDRNRLQCRFSTLWGQKADTHSAPLQTWEIRRLLSGLQLLWTKATKHLTLSFPAPGLSLDAKVLSNDAFRLQIQLDHDLTPSWHKYPDFPMEMAIFLSRDQLQEAIQELAGQIDAYPER